MNITLKLDTAQLKNETYKWIRSLRSITDENIQLKSSLSHIIKNEFNEALLEKAEKFHNHFIKQDQLISLLRNDIVELEALLAKANKNNLTEIRSKVIKLRENISNALIEFGKLKEDFTSQLSAHS